MTVWSVSRSRGRTPHHHSVAASKLQAAFRSKNANRKIKAVEKIAKKVSRNQSQSGIKVLLEPRTQYNNASSTFADLRPVVPSVQQAAIGTGPGAVKSDTIDARNGDSIRLTSLKVKGVITIPCYDSNQSEDRSLIACRLVCFSCKRYPCYRDMQDNWNTGEQLQRVFLREGAEPLGFDGSLARLWLPINSEVFTSHYDKTFYLNRGYLDKTSFSDLTGSSASAAHMPNVYKPFNIRLKCKNKVLKYSTPTRTDPSNYGPQVYLMYAFVDGASPSVAAVPFMQYNSQMTWKED